MNLKLFDVIVLNLLFDSRTIECAGIQVLLEHSNDLETFAPSDVRVVRSSIWNKYHCLVANGEDTFFVQCLHCKKVLKCAHGTSVLRSHYKSCS